MEAMTDERRRVLTLSAILREHRYESRDRLGDDRGEPGWHACSCGSWQGYWFEWQDHVAESIFRAGYLAPQ